MAYWGFNPNTPQEEREIMEAILAAEHAQEAQPISTEWTSMGGYKVIDGVGTSLYICQFCGETRRVPTYKTLGPHECPELDMVDFSVDVPSTQDRKQDPT